MACVPGEHAWHIAPLLIVTLPVVHLVQVTSPPALAHLAGHILHARASGSVESSYFPGAQIEHDVCRPRSFVTMPSPQRVQLVCALLVVYQSEGQSEHHVEFGWLA